MEIERINDSTIKFKISYMDIEERGFTKDEIWYNREKGEELFWSMMEEATMLDEFSIDGPLWIQVQALEKGIEITVTRTQLSSDGQKLEVPINQEKVIQLPIDEKLEQLLEQHMENVDILNGEQEEQSDVDYSFLISFRDIEDVISFSQRLVWEDIETTLYQFEDRYYLYVTCDEFLFEEEEVKLLRSLGLEYGDKTQVTVHRLQEYGNCIIKKEALQVLQQYFTAK